MKAYIDDSLTEGQILVFGGLIASAEKWEEFSVAWQQCLEDAPWDDFKMSKVWHRCKGDRLKHAQRHYRTMCDHVQGGLCFVVPIAPLTSLATRYSLSHTVAAKPYLWAFKGIINGLAQNQQAWGLSEPVDFVFDERPRDEKDSIREGWKIYLETAPENVRLVTGKLPVFANDKQELPLQAADMWSWWCRKTWLANGGTIPKDSYPVRWGNVGDIPQMILQWTSEDINQELARISDALSTISN